MKPPLLKAYKGFVKRERLYNVFPSVPLRRKMGKMEGPYKIGTKSFLIAQRLQKGENYETIEKELRVNRKTIYNVKSMLKKLGLLPENYSTFSVSSSSSPESPPKETFRKNPREVSLFEGAVREAEGNFLGKEVSPREKAFAEAAEKELMVQATPILRKVVLNPRIYLFYDYSRTRLGFKGDFGDFIADCVDDFFNSRGIKIKIVREEEVS